MKKQAIRCVFLSALAGFAVQYAAAQTGVPLEVNEPLSLYPPHDKLMASPGNTTYFVDPVGGDDVRTGTAKTQAWKSIARVNAMKLAQGDRVVIGPGVHRATLKPSGAGAATNPVVIQFQPGVHEFAVENAVRRPYFVSNACDNPTTPKPIGLLFEKVSHIRVEGGGVTGDRKTEIRYGGRMIEIVNDQAEDITYSGLVFDLKRPTVSEFRVLGVTTNRAVIQIAEGSDYAVENGKFVWKGDWGTGGLYCQEVILEEGRCWRRDAPQGWNEQGQSAAMAIDLGGRKIQLDYGQKESGLTQGRHYQLRLGRRDSVGIHTTCSKNIVFRDCDFYALTNMGFVSQFTENITYQRVNVAPPAGTLRTCAAWADIFQFSNCKGELLVEGCRLSGMQDDAVNCHGTHLRIIEKLADNQLLMRFMHPQTYGFAAYAPGDEIAVINHANLREYDKNPRRKVVQIEARNEKDWLLTLDGPVPSFGPNDVLDNITWNPNLTLRNNHISIDPVRGFLITTRGKVLVEGNTFARCALSAILIEDDAESWFESGPVRDMLIRGNTFQGCGISINPQTKSSKPEEPVHENIRIVDNVFDDAGVSARNVKGLTVTGNRTSKRPLRINLEPSCSETHVEKNGEYEAGMAWYNPTHWGVEGRGWTNGLARYYDRLPAKAEKTVPGGVWYYSRQSAGLSARFATDASNIDVRYRLSSGDLSHGWADNANMSASGIDLYAQTSDATSGKPVWRWVGGNKPTSQSATNRLVGGLAQGRRLYVLNLPVYNGVESIEIGVPEGASFDPMPPRPEPPIVFYGTSIMQGGVASRPGLAIPAIVGRRLDRPVINFGFCGSGCMDAPVVELMAEINAAAYVIDCEPNMGADTVSQRTEPLVRLLRQAHPDTPILLVEDHESPSPELFPGAKASIQSKQAALRAVYDRLVKDGVKQLYYLPGKALIGDDSEGTGDGIHPNAIGMLRYADAYTAALTALFQGKKQTDL
jgi:hypothetical protein